ncbi:Na+:solute symporter [candidate division KSB1 bacterium]|nr:Na+:solute symporter [candidate division KSB1 bacterium]
MELHIVDILIILVYIAATIFIGFYIRKRAAKNLDSYFLGDKGMPWYVLGVSNASGMFDITGTMWLVYIMFVYGLKSAFLPWVWPTFNQIFLMMFLAAWLRRSNVLTGAEWITTRFGKNIGSTLSHISVVVFALVSVIGFLAYAFQGIGKFAATLLPWSFGSQSSTAHIYALIFMCVTAIYVISGGMFSVVFTEVLQFIIMTISSIVVGIIAMRQVSPHVLQTLVPEGWDNLFFGWRLDIDWTNLMPSVMDKIAADDYTLFGGLFGAFFMMMLFKGILVSLAGPAPNYDMQRILATRSAKEAGKMSGFVSVALFFPRYMMIAGLTVLAIVFYSPQLNQMGAHVDFEQVLPFAIKNFIPVGLMGVLLAGLLSAFMSTFAATVNAAPAYVVNDIYKRYIKPDASNKTLITLSYIISAVFVGLGILFGFLSESINQVTLWITSALWGGYAAPNVLKWYWWRFNGHGYFWGMISGILGAIILPGLSKYGLIPPLNAMESFPIIFGISLLGSIFATFATKPEKDDVLVDFYTRVRPWGFWKPVHQKAVAQYPDFKANENFRRDMVNVFAGIAWQMSMLVMPVYLVIQNYTNFAIAIGVFIVTSIFIKFNWWNKLED